MVPTEPHLASRVKPSKIEKNCSVSAEALVSKMPFETLTVRLGGGVLVTSTAVTDSSCDAEVDTVTVGGVTPMLLAAEVCNAAVGAVTVREGGGVRVTALAVADKEVDTLAPNDTSEMLRSMR